MLDLYILQPSGEAHRWGMRSSSMVFFSGWAVNTNCCNAVPAAANAILHQNSIQWHILKSLVMLMMCVSFMLVYRSVLVLWVVVTTHVLSCRRHSPARFARKRNVASVTLAAPNDNLVSYPAMSHMCICVLIHEDVGSCIRDMHRCRDHVALAVSFPSVLLHFHGCSAFLRWLRVAIIKKGRALMSWDFVYICFRLWRFRNIN